MNGGMWESGYLLMALALAKGVQAARSYAWRSVGARYSRQQDWQAAQENRKRNRLRKYEGA